MPSQITFGANILPLTTSMEVSINGGTTFVTVPFTTVGSAQQDVLSGVPAGTYAPGQLILGAVGFPATRQSNLLSINVINNTLSTPTGVSASPASTSSINVIVNSTTNNAGGYRLLAADASTGIYAQIYQGMAATFLQAGLAASQTKYYKWQYVGGGLFNDSQLSAIFSGTTTAGTFTTLIPVLANYSFNGSILRTNAAGQNLHAGLSQLQINLGGSTSGTLNVFSTGGSANVLAYDGTTLLGELPAGANSLTGLSGGILTLYMGGQQRSYEQGYVQGADVTSFVFPGTSTGSFVSPVQTTRAIAIPGDSISNGALLSSPQSQSWTTLLRKTGVSSTVMGYGSGTASVMFDPNYWLNPNPASGISLKAELHAILDGATEQAIITSIGTNDYGGANGGAAVNGGLSPTDFQTRFNTFLTNVTTEFPSAKILIITPFYRTDEASTNSYTALLQAYRDAETATAAGRAAVTVYDGRGILITSDLVDGVHPNAAGHLKILNLMQPALDSVFNGTSTMLVDMAGLAAANYTQLVNATVSGTTISKLSTSINQFDGGAVATFLLGTTTGSGAKGQVKYTVPTAVRTGTSSGGTVFGVSTAAPNYSAVSPTNGGPTNFISIAAAFYFDGSKYGLIEAGQERPFITYPWPATGALPMLDILVTESQVKYYANRVLLYTSAYNPIPAFPLYVDVAMSTPTSSALTGLQIAGVNLVATPAPVAAVPITNAAVAWANFRNTAVDSSLLHLVSATALGSNGFNGGSSSTVAIGVLAGTTEVGRLSFPGITPAPTGYGSWVAGLMSGATYTGAASVGDEYYGKIKYAIYRDATLYRVFELGTKMFEAAFPAGATYKLEIVVFNAYVSYQRDGVEFYRSTVAPAMPLYAEAVPANAANYATSGSYLTGITISAGNGIASGF